METILVPIDLVLFAFRYALTRHSYAVGEIAAFLHERWQDIPEGARNTILQDLREHNERVVLTGELDDITTQIDANVWRELEIALRGR